MKIQKIQNPKNIGWIVVLIVMVLLYASYYLIYIPQQEAQLKERGFRILKEYAQNIHDKHEYYKNHLKIYAGYYSLRERYSKQKFRDDYENSGIDTTLINNIFEVTANLHQTISVGSNFVNDSAISDSIIFKLDSDSYTSINDSVFLKYKKSEITDKYAKIPVSTLMEGLKFDKLFKNISLLTDSEVLYNSNGSVINDLTETGKLIDTLANRQGGIILPLEIQGIKTNVMVLPITFLNDKFYLAGFIPDVDFKQKTRTINNQFLTIIAGLLLLILIGMPILKIVFINQKERLNVKDIHLANISLILSLGIFLLLFIGAIKHYVIDKIETEKRIEQLSDKLTENVTKDFDALINLGDSIINGITENYEISQSVRNILNGVTLDVKSKTLVKNTSNYDTIPNRFLKTNFPINEVILIDKNGEAIKAATSTVFSDLVPLDLSNRLYYKSHTTGESWDFDRNFAKKIYIESIKSYNSGFQETAISFTLNNDSVFKTKAPYLAITSHIPSLYEQVVPQDVEYVIIDKMGKVLFHSEQSKNLHENFLIESNNQHKLKAALEYRTIENTKIIYNEREWLARIVPLKNKPLYHVTLIDLGHTDFKNAKVYLFTFYFLLFTFFFIWLGMQIIQKTKPKENFMDTKMWSFKWVLFHPFKFKHYKQLLIIQSVLCLIQVLGFFIIVKPIEMLIYQLIFIGYSGFAALLILRKTKSVKSVLVVSSIVTLLITAILILCTKNYIFLIPLILLSILTFYLFITLDKKTKEKSDSRISQKIYLNYMFLWTLCLTIIPVFSYYKTIEYQEERLSEKSKMMNIADQNLHLLEHYNNYSRSNWYSRITGDGLDNITIKDSCKSLNPNPPFLEKTDSFYSALPSPKKGIQYLMPLLKKQNKTNDWSDFNSSEICYSNATMSNVVVVDSKRMEKLNSGKGVLSSSAKDGIFYKWILLLCVPIFFLIFLIWSFYKYLANIILNTVLANWKSPNTPAWKTLIEVNQNNPIQRILLVSTKSNKYLNSTACLYSTKVIKGDEISKADFNASLLDFTAEEKVIWIKDLETELLQIDNYDLIFSNLNEIEKIAGDRKIVLETAIDFDFIKEYFEDYILEYNIEKAEEIKILQKIGKLRTLLKNYFRFTGKIDKESIQAVFKSLFTENENEQNLLANAHLMKLQYNHIWNNLSRMEKLILFDLADDGMLNTKNKFLINRLKMKGLISIQPYPKIFTPSFKYFLKYSINQEETMQLENKLRKQGQWRNTKYLILVILIPLAALIFISQGTSIDKIIGIFTGVVALFSGSMRLIDGGLLQSSSK